MSSNKNTPKKKSVLINVIFVVVVLAIAAALLVARNLRSTSAALRAELIYGDDNTTMNLPLDVNDTYDVDPLLHRPHRDQGRRGTVRGFPLPGSHL